MSRQFDPLCEVIAPSPVLVRPAENKLMTDLARLLTFCTADPAVSMPGVYVCMYVCVYVFRGLAAYMYSFLFNLILVLFNFLMQELTSIFTLSSLLLVNSGTLYLNLYFHLPPILS